MNHRRILTTLAAVIVTLGCWTASCSTADAGCFGHHWRRSHFGWGYRSYGVGWASYGGYGYGGYGLGGYGLGGYGYRGCGWSSYYSWAPQVYAPTYYYTPSYGCCNYGCYGCGGCFSSNTYSGISAVGYATNSTPSYASLAAATVDRAAAPAAAQMMELRISVPEDARVIINDRPTTTKGSERSYVVRGAKAGTSYSFVVRAELDRNGQTLTDTKRIVLRAGQSSDLAFDIRPEIKPAVTADQLVNTTLKLHVPDNSKVFLAGTEMKQNSGVCLFETDRLQAGETLADYNIRVTYMADGKEESIEKMVTLVGGQTQEIQFAMDPSTRLASR